MDRMAFKRYACGAVLFACLAAYPALASAQEIAIQSSDWRSWRALQAATPERQVTLKASWRFPESQAESLPAIVLMHSAGGIIGGEATAITSFVRAGYAVLVVNRFSRGNQQGDRPLNQIADAFNSLKAAASHPRVDTKRIAIVGISSGGHAVLGSNNEGFRRKFIEGDLRYAAHLAFYPACTFATFGPGSTTRAPMLFIMAERDNNAPARMCQDVAALHQEKGIPSRIEVSVIAGAPHAFLNPDGERLKFDNEKSDMRDCPVLAMGPGFQGLYKSGVLTPVQPVEGELPTAGCARRGSYMGFDPAATEKAMRQAIAFLDEHLGVAR